MSKQIKNLLLELSEYEEDLIIEFCVGNRLGDPIEITQGDGRKVKIISDLDTPIAKIYVGDDEGTRLIIVEILGLEENKQLTKEATDINELVKILLFIQNEILRK